MPHERAILLMGIYPPAIALTVTQSGLYENVHCNIVIERSWKQHKCPSTREWIHKMQNMQIMKYFAVIKVNILDP